MSQLYDVCVAAPLPHSLTYQSRDELARGQSVQVSIGKRLVSGVVLGPTQKTADSTKEFEVKEVRAVDLERPRIPETYMKWLAWLSQYYIYPLGQVFALAFPPLPRSTKTRASKKREIVPMLDFKAPHPLTSEQQKCYEAIAGQKGFHVHLLFGVTGSGKTEVYLRLIQDVLDRGEQVLVLVPEISLTPQLIHRFAQRFGQEKIAVIHSHLTEREKTNQWWDAQDGKKPILIGARSALFCPLVKLGLIIIDEEHEPSFKQEEMLKYHARDAAVMLAHFQNCPIVLGSATPSLESFNNAKSGKYQLHEMPSRVENRRLPKVEVVELREERSKRRDPEQQPKGTESLPFWLSQDLYERMIATLARKEQVALFLNRRGVAQSVICNACAAIRECPNCAVSLTLHGSHHLICHYCGYDERMKDTCPECQTGELHPLGLGTELIEDDLKKLFPTSNIARADRDQIQKREEIEDLVRSMETGETDILIGTQMIAKGWDFERLTLVGMILADVGFNLPDFRASERSFQLLTQVSGRSGRHRDELGQVVIQTYNPHHPSIVYTQSHDFPSFAEYELKNRQELNYPPFGRLASIRIQSLSKETAEQASQFLASRAKNLIRQLAAYGGVEVLGPAPAPIAKLRGFYRYHLLLKAPQAHILNSFCRQVVGDSSWLPAKTKLLIDIDPMSLI